MMKKIVLGIGLMTGVISMASAHPAQDDLNRRDFAPYYGNHFYGCANCRAQYYPPSCSNNPYKLYQEEQRRYNNCKKYHQRYSYCDYYDSYAYTHPYSWYYYD